MKGGREAGRERERRRQATGVSASVMECAKDLDHALHLVHSVCFTVLNIMSCNMCARIPKQQAREEQV